MTKTFHRSQKSVSFWGRMPCRLWGVAVAASVLMLCRTVPAQPGFPTTRQSQQLDLFRPAPRVLQQYLRRAEKAIADQDYRAAVELLGSILSGQTEDPDLAEIQQDYFVRGLADERHRTSIKARALQLLGQLPAEGRQWYELKYGTEAAQLVRRAIADRDISKLHEVTRKYFHTRAGYDAAVLLGRWQLDQGHPLAAALSLKRLYDVPHAAGEYEPTLSLLLAASWLRAGMEQQAVDVIVSLKQRSSGNGVSLGGRTVSWFTTNENARKWLEEHLQGASIDLHEREQQWVLYRGNPQRNGLTDGGFPLMHFRWRTATVIDPADAELVAERRLMYDSEDRVVLPAFQPLAVGDIVVMRTPRWVFGVDLKTGKLVWNYPWFQETLGGVADDADEQTAFNTNRVKRRDELVQRVWEDAPYGQLASDGERVYLLDEMPYAASGRVRPQVIFGPNFNRNQPPTRRGNQLVACSLAEEGKLHWIVGGETGEDEPRLAGAFFLGPPLPLMGQLFVLAEMAGEIRLVVLDAQTGRLQWFQQVAHVAEQTIDLDPNRRLAGATPSFDDGILVCPTSAGACVAVDLATRSLLWGYQYPAFRAPMNRYRPTPFPPMGERWADGTVTLAQGAVLLTPVESNQLHCLDLLTGKPRWEPIDRDGMLFIGGVHQGVVFLVGTDRCRGISIETGEPAWEADLELGAARPSGRGFLTGRYYFLPTTSSELLQIDIVEGKVVQSVKTDLVLGNLISYRDQIISLNVDWLACYYQADPLRRLVETRLKENPDDLWALLRHAELLIHDQRRDEALETLQRAYRLRPEDEVVRELLVASLMQALHEDFRRYRKVAQELEELIDQPRQRLAYLRLLVDGSLQEGDWAAAWRSLESLLASVESHRDAALLGELTTLLRVDPRYKVRFDRWLAGRVSQVYRQGDSATRQAIDKKVASTLKEADDLLALRRLHQVYGAVPGTDEARLELARKLAQGDNGRTEAELVISDLVDPNSHASPRLQAEALALQAELMEKTGRPREALMVARRLEKQFGDILLTRGVAASKWARDIEARLTKHPGVEAHWPNGKVVVDRSQGPTVSTSYVYAFRTKAIAGATEQGTHVRYDLRTRQIQVLDPFGRVEVALRVGRNFSANGPWPFQVSHRGHLTLVNAGFETFLIDRLGGQSGRDYLRWKADTSGSLGSRSFSSYRAIQTNVIQGTWGGARYRPTDRSSHVLLGRLGLFLSHAVVYQKGRELVCVEPMTGELLWSRSGYEPGCEIFGEGDRVYVIEPDAETASVLRVWDGIVLGQRPVPPLEQRWRSVGEDLLTCVKTEKNLLLARRDLWTQTDRWKLEVPTDTLLAEVSPNSLAIARRDGTVTVISVHDGKPIVRYQGEPITKGIRQMWVMASDSDYLVILSGETKSQNGVHFSSPMPWRCPLVTGYLLSLDRQSGKLRWQKPATVAGYAIPLDQPPQSPVLLMMRQMRGANQLRASNTANRPSIMCLDRRHGNPLIRDEVVSKATTYQVFADTTKHLVDVRMTNRRWTFTFTDKPEDPSNRRPLEMELKATLRVSDAVESVGRMAEELFKGLQGAQKKSDKRPQPAKPQENSKQDAKDDK